MADKKDGGRSTRFKPGQTGNPSGRPRKPAKQEQISSPFEVLQDRRITVQMPAGERKLTVPEALCYRTYQDALAGDRMAIIATFAMSRTDAGLITSGTLVTTAIGGWFGGALSDRYGRLAAFRGSILAFAVMSIFVALAQTSGQLLLARSLQGFGFGAEWAAGAVLMAESVDERFRGRALGVVQSGWALGWGAAALASAVALSLLPGTTAWRVLFALALLPALIALFLSRNLSPGMPVAKSDGATLPSAGQALVSVFRRENLRGTLVAGLLAIGAHGGYYGLFSWLPTYLKTERGLSVIATSGYLAVIIVAFWIGCIVAGSLSDRFGRRTTIAGYAAGCIVIALLYILAPVSDNVMILLGFPLGFCAAGIPATMGALFSELYPAETRGSGVGFCYNGGRLVAAGFPVLIGAMSDKISLGTAIAIDASAAYGLVIVAVALLPNRPLPENNLQREVVA
ncbi:MAG: MFS transporter [Croceibacterium sp.]